MVKVQYPTAEPSQEVTVSATQCKPQPGNQMDAISASVGLSDSGFAIANELTRGMTVPKNVDLQALRVVGGAASGLSIGLSVYDFRTNLREGNRAGAALNALDVGVGLAGLLIPPAAPFALGYGVTRSLSDTALVLKKTGCN